jgi:ankyrin repeat protein
LRECLTRYNGESAGGAAKAILGFRDGKRHTAAHFAANLGQAGCLRLLLETCPEAANAADDDGTTPLMMAILGQQPGAMECIEVLLEHKVDLDARRVAEHDNALHIAARGGFSEAVLRLVRAGASMASHSVVGTALHEASLAGELDVVNTLLDAYAREHGMEGMHAWVDSSSASGASALLLAIARGEEDTTVRLIEAGADIHFETEKGLTALHLMAEMGMNRALEVAAKHMGEDSWRRKNDDGLIPIQLAAANGHLASVEALWDASRHGLASELKCSESEVAEPSLLVELEQRRRTAEEGATAAAAAASSASAVEGDTFEVPEGETSEQDQAAALSLKEEGNTSFAKGDWAAAVAKYSEAIAKDPRSTVYRLNRSLARLKAGDALGAVSDAVVARKLDDTCTKAYYREGVARMALEQWEEAAQTLYQGTLLDPSSADLRSKFQRSVALGQAAHQAKLKRDVAERQVLIGRAREAEERLAKTTKASE